ncbi:MAG: tyrosine-type recombinase/integrase [Frankia sp.]
MASIEHIGQSIRVIWREDGRKQYERFVDDDLGLAGAKAYRTAVEACGNRRPSEPPSEPGRPPRPWPGQACTLDHWWDYWITGVTGIEDYSRKTNIRIYRQHIRPRFGNVEITRIDRTEVGQWANEMSAVVKPKTVRNRLAVLTAVLGGAMDPPHALITANPAAKIKVRESIEEEMRFLTEPELSRLVAACSAYYRPLIVLAVATGMRWGELAGLRRMDVSTKGDKTYITVRQSLKRTYDGDHYFGPPKTKAARRRISVPAYAATEISALLEGDPQGLVFTTREGNHLVGPNFRKAVWRPTLKKAGLAGLRFHDLRHTAVTFFIASGATLYEVMRKVGHTSYDFTVKQYGHLLPEEDDRTTDAMNVVLAGALPADTYREDEAAEVDDPAA